MNFVVKSKRKSIKANKAPRREDDFMSKYQPLWNYVKDKNEPELTLSFKEIESILGFSLDHSFLTYKKELFSYGFKVDKISMKLRTVIFRKIKKDKLVVYIHGKGGSASEAERYKDLFLDCDAIGLEYKSRTPWDAEKEFLKLFGELSRGYTSIILVANSVGAYFSMHAFKSAKIDEAFFISPVVDMETLILNMMRAVNVSEKELEDRKTIETPFGETLSWEYLSYVRTNPITWNVPTYVLYGANDNLTDEKKIKTFSEKFKARLTVMEGGEHWFHTEEQLNFLDKWITENLKP